MDANAVLGQEWHCNIRQMVGNFLLSVFLSAEGLLPHWLLSLLLLFTPLARDKRTLHSYRRVVVWETEQLLELSVGADKAERSSAESLVEISQWMMNILPEEKNMSPFSGEIVIARADFQRFLSLFSILAWSHHGKTMFYGFWKGIWWIYFKHWQRSSPLSQIHSQRYFVWVTLAGKQQNISPLPLTHLKMVLFGGK